MVINKNIKVMKIISASALFLCLCFVTACECVTSLDTPKKILPSESSDIVFTNCLSDDSKVNLSSNSLSLFENITNSLEFFDYKKTYASSNFIQITDSSNSPIFNGLITLDKNIPYTFVLYGTNTRARLASMRDSLFPLNAGEGYFRIINLISSQKTINVKIMNRAAIELKTRAFTVINSMASGLATIEITDAETNNELLRQTLDIESNYLNNIIILADETGNNIKIKKTKNRVPVK